MKLFSRLVSLTGAGTARKLSADLGISPQAIYMWRRVPPARIIQIHKRYGITIEKIESLTDEVQK